MMHTAVAGDSIPSIAYAAGLFPDTVWNDPQNAELKALRGDMNVLFPGDVVFVPEKKRRMETAATDQRHKFRRKGVPCKLRIQLFHVETPRANEEYEVSIEGAAQKGKADSKGIVEFWVAPNARQGTLTIGPDRTVIELRLGHMDPLTEVAGLQKRLANIGYPCGDDPPGEIREATREALRSLQRRYQLKETGEFDGATRGLLDTFHDHNELFPDDPWLVRP